MPVVPPAFVQLVHVTLYKLVGVQLISKDLVSTEFFQKLRVRFQNASKKVTYSFNTIINNSIVLKFKNFIIYRQTTILPMDVLCLLRAPLSRWVLLLLLLKNRDLLPQLPNAMLMGVLSLLISVVLPMTLQNQGHQNPKKLRRAGP